MKKDRPIGVFDSGIGGLTVAKEILKQMPKERIIYFADTANVPYGEKLLETIKKIALSIIKFLVLEDVKAIVIGCNISSAIALDDAKKIYNIPIFGLIDTTAEDVVKNFEIKKIGVIGTSATIKSRAYEIEIQKKNKNLKVLTCACPEFVPIVEKGEINSHRTKKIVRKYIMPFVEEKIDALILGCTHYPYLENIIKEITGEKIKIIDPAKIIAKKAKEILKSKNLLHRNKTNIENKFFVSGSSSSLQNLGSRFLKTKITNIVKVRWEDYNIYTEIS